MSSEDASTHVRRHLSERQLDTVARLLDAAFIEIRTTGYDGVTVRNVAKRAGVAPATAYTYFASKDHLIAEVFWRRLRALPDTVPDRRYSAAGRVNHALRDVGMLVESEPELAAATTIAMMASDPDVVRLRERIGGFVDARVVAAVGNDLTPQIRDVFRTTFTGVMLEAGLGYYPYSELAQRMAVVAELAFGRR